MKNTRGGPRAHNLLLSREEPYPLGHTSYDALAPRLAIMHTSWPTAETLLKTDTTHPQHCSKMWLSSSPPPYQALAPSRKARRPQLLLPFHPWARGLHYQPARKCKINFWSVGNLTMMKGSNDMVHICKPHIIDATCVISHLLPLQLPPQKPSLPLTPR